MFHHMNHFTLQIAQGEVAERKSTSLRWSYSFVKNAFFSGIVWPQLLQTGDKLYISAAA